MPVAAETLYNTRHLNIIFAATSVVTAASVLWMLRDDHERPWRGVQNTQFDLQSALAHFELLDLTSDQSRAQRKELENKLAEAESQAKAHAVEERRLESEEKVKAGLLQGAAASFGNANAQIQVTQFEFEENKTLHGPNDARTRAVRETLERDERELSDLLAKKEKLEDELAGIRDSLKRLREPVVRASKELGAFDKKVADAERREQMYAGGLASYRTVFNMPGFDFVAPKGTPGREEVKQVKLDEVRQDYNFLQSYSVDRCMTCHVAIDEPGATVEAFVARAESAMREINRRRAKKGKPPLKVELRREGTQAEGHAGMKANGAVAPGEKPLPAFAAMDREQRQAYLPGLEAALNEYLTSEGRAPIKLGQPLWSHPRLDLFISPDSPHPLSKMGCTACHEGNGQETDFMYAAHTPNSHAQEEEWAEKYYVKTWGIPQATFHLIEEYWDRPMMPTRFTQATCAKCHAEISDLASARGDSLAPKLTEGRKLFTQLGCVNCHLVEGLGDSRRVGPELSHVTQKLDTGFIDQWVLYPRGFRPSTLMPHFFRQENQLASSGNETDPAPALRNETEIQAITHYLTTFSKSYEPLPLPTGKSGDAKRGWELFTSVGCLACHASLATVDPNDEKGRTFGRRWIETDLIKSGVKAEAAKARVAKMTLNEQSAYAIQHFTEERHAAAMQKLEAMRSRGDDTAGLYLPPTFSRFAPDLSGIGTKLAPEPAKMERGRTWLFNWLKNPNHYHPGSKMPRLFRDNYYWREADAAKREALGDQEILDVAEYLLSLRHDEFQQREFPSDDAHLAMTRTLILDQLVGQFTEDAAKSLLADKKTSPQEPMGQLSAAIVKQVERSIGHEAAVAKVSAQGMAERQKLYLGVRMLTHYGCSACHVIPGFENATRPGTELTFWGEKPLTQLDFAFFAPGFEGLPKKEPQRFGTLYPESAEFEHLVAANGNEPQEITHTRAAFGYHKVRNPRIWDRGKIKKPYDKLKMPNFFLSKEQAESLTTFLLSRVQPRVTDAIKVDYVRTPLGGIAAGRHLTTELNCVGCHRIEENEPEVQQYGIVEDPSGGVMVDELNLPPWLHGEGAKINHAWLSVFLRQVEMLRPWLKIRMPNFPLDEAQAATLVKYFASVSKHESGEVAKRLAEVHGYVAKAAAGSPPSSAASKEARKPGDDWFANADLRPSKEFLADYALRYRLSQPAALNEKDNNEASLAKAYSSVDRGVGFLADLYEVTYPFAESPRPLMSAGRFALGQKMFLEMKCLACHVLGDPSAKGANPNPTAPNLGLTQRRLRRGWVHGWLQYPARIQPGTKMPQWWGEGGSLAQFPKEDYAAFAAKYGKTFDEQMLLLEDFLYESGERSYTVIDESAAAPTAPAAPQPAAGATEDEFGEQPASKPAATKEDKKPADDFNP